MGVGQIVFLVVLTAFYGAYLAKMLLLRRQGVRGNILGKGSKPKGVVMVERCIQAITYTGAAVQYGSVFFPGLLGTGSRNFPLWLAGLVLAALGVALFVAAVWVMKDSWRAGYSEDQNTALITGGVYKISRNPAFTGFDLLYIGCALAYPNVLTVVWCVLAVAVFHLQIRSEEAYLARAFGGEYEGYRKRVGRYFGRRSGAAG